MTSPHHPTPPSSPLSEARPDIRLVVTDMDGTLLDGEGRIPEDFWPLLRRMERRGIVFCPASGRQYATLREQFRRAAADTVFIAENGTYVVQDGRELSSDVLDRDVVTEVVGAMRELPAQGVDVGTVVCGKKSAYVERADAAFLAEVRKYYARLEQVEDVTAVDDDLIKLAFYDFGRAEEGTAPALKPYGLTHQVVLSGEHWIDVMNPTANKGAAVRGLQRRLGITPEQTVVFGDYLNDAEMLDTATWSFAMANAHPEIKLRARHHAPAHTEHGVLTTLAALLGPA
ncbi:Cof-type HAD-IIB family hydrolase [Streptomyces sp. NBC_00670]|jgi:Cof subfamily protein (haloacid dehalogenase superfamily)|uniref:Cof-type HAD-IIB family hydrolase n=1 Tax=Streptomyces sp. NBC_00670 TaxID=2975804 RepID=UPI002E37ACE5|nr:Cof-type HAD-IIB family hydrolase [Streptomyces sp. NBC_00670]